MHNMTRLPMPNASSTVHTQVPTQVPLRSDRRVKKVVKRKAEAEDIPKDLEGLDCPEQQQFMDIDNGGGSTGMFNSERPFTKSVLYLCMHSMTIDHLYSRGGQLLYW